MTMNFTYFHAVRNAVVLIMFTASVSWTPFASMGIEKLINKKWIVRMHVYATSKSESVCSHNDSSSSLVYASRVFLLSANACVSSVTTDALLSWGLVQGGSAVTEWEGISSFPTINLQQETEDHVCKCDQDTVTAQVRTRTTYFNAENAKPFRPSLLLQHRNT